MCAYACMRVCACVYTHTSVWNKGTTATTNSTHYTGSRVHKDWMCFSGCLLIHDHLKSKRKMWIVKCTLVHQ